MIRITSFLHYLQVLTRVTQTLLVSKNAEFDALLDKAIGLTNKDERAALYKQAQVIFHEQAPWIPVAHSVGFAPLSPRVKGYVQSPFGYDAFYGVSVDGK